jgi:hypothetical protein
MLCMTQKNELSESGGRISFELRRALFEGGLFMLISGSVILLAGGPASTTSSNCGSCGAKGGNASDDRPASAPSNQKSGGDSAQRQDLTQSGCVGSRCANYGATSADQSQEMANRGSSGNGVWEFAKDPDSPYAPTAPFQAQFDGSPLEAAVSATMVMITLDSYPIRGTLTGADLITWRRRRSLQHLYGWRP